MSTTIATPSRKLFLPPGDRRRRIMLPAQYHRAPSNHDSFDESNGAGFIESTGHARDEAEGDLIIGGTFVSHGAALARIARKDKITGTISQLGGGIGSGIVKCLCQWNGKLVIGGSQAEGSGKNKLQTWDGSNYGALASGVTNGPAGYSVNACASYLTDLYIGGNFTEVDGVAMTNLAKWDKDLGQWVDIGGANGIIYDMVVQGGLLYVVGAFTSIAGVSAKNKAYFNGSSWANLGNSAGPQGVSPQTEAIGFYNGKAIVTGNWTRIDGTTSAFNANRVAINDGTTTGNFVKMDAPTDGFDNNGPTYGRRIVQVGDRTFFTGVMNTAGNKSSVGRFCAWDGTNFQKYGTGFGGTIGYAMYYWQKLIYIGGRASSGTSGRLRTFNPETDTFGTSDDTWSADINCINEYAA